MSVVGAHLCYTAPSAKIFVSKLFSGSPLQVCRRQVYENLDQAMSSLHHPTGSSPEIIISVWKRHWGGDCCSKMHGTRLVTTTYSTGAEWIVLTHWEFCVKCNLRHLALYNMSEWTVVWLDMNLLHLYILVLLYCYTRRELPVVCFYLQQV